MCWIRKIKEFLQILLLPIYLRHKVLTVVWKQWIHLSHRFVHQLFFRTYNFISTDQGGWKVVPMHFNSRGSSYSCHSVIYARRAAKGWFNIHPSKKLSFRKAGKQFMRCGWLWLRTYWQGQILTRADTIKGRYYEGEDTDKGRYWEGQILTRTDTD